MGASRSGRAGRGAGRGCGDGSRRGRRRGRGRAGPLAAQPGARRRAARARGTGRRRRPAALAVPLVMLAAWLPEPPAEPGPEFSPVVLSTLLLFAVAALALLIVGQFAASSPWLAAALATVTVLTGMARAGLTVTERLRASHEQALTDDLTGLGNRRHLHRAARRGAIASGARRRVRAAADRPRRLQGAQRHARPPRRRRGAAPDRPAAGATLLRADDTLARLGGDEFAVVLAPGRRGAASAAGLRLRAALERSFDGRRHRACTSTPASASRCSPSTRSDALGLLQRADVAMYEAKRTRTGHEVYAPARDRHSRAAARAARRAARRAGGRRSSSCTTSPRRRSRPARCTASRRWCAGSTRSAGCCGPASSCRWPSTAGSAAR